MKLLALLIALLIQSLAISAQNLIEQKEIDSLRGIGQIDLLIENLPVTLRSSISDSQLQDECELRLRRGGVPISPKNIDLPYLYVIVNAVPLNANGKVFLTEISLRQPVLLARDLRISQNLGTWRKVRLSASSDELRGSILAIIDQFITDYVAGNATSKAPDLKPSLRDAGPKFEEHYVGGNRLPEITVKNTANRTLYLAFGGRTYSVTSGGVVLIKTSEAGFYDFSASITEAIPLVGQREFKLGYLYTWTFFVRDTR